MTTMQKMLILVRFNILSTAKDLPIIYDQNLWKECGQDIDACWTLFSITPLHYGNGNTGKCYWQIRRSFMNV